MPRRGESTFVGDAGMRVRHALFRLMLLVDIFACFILFVPTLRSQGTPVTASADILIQRNVAMKTRDGVTLHADIYRPNSSDKVPVILMRTPYDKSANWAATPAFKIVPRGYISSFRMSEAAIPPRGNGIRLGMSRPTGTMPWNGLRRCLTRMARSA